MDDKKRKAQIRRRDRARVNRALRKIHASNENDYHRFTSGICSCVDVLVVWGTDVYGVMKPLFQKWPHFSGDNIYPIPSPYDGETASGAYNRTPREHFWNRNHPYGRLRWDLLEFMINETGGFGE